MYRRRMAGRRAGRPLEPTQPGAGHVRLRSDTSQLTSGVSLGNGYQGMNGSFVTPTVTALSPTARTDSDTHSYFGSVAHSDTLHSSVSPLLRAAVSPPQANTETRNRQNIVVPFAFGLDPTHQQESREDRKRVDRAINPVNNSPTPISHAADPSASYDDLPNRPRINPPAYDDVIFATSRPRTAITDPTNQGSGDTSFSADSIRSESPTRTAPGANSVLELGDVGHMNDRPDTMSGTGGTLATGMSVQMPRNQVYRPFI